ncbi:MAG TPA: CocE/NonD family hydrolase [Mycobacteriales bacterium]|nr:CocE/NonD family hydrolase [Mycobacteriales bacterium]
MTRRRRALPVVALSLVAGLLHAGAQADEPTYGLSAPVDYIVATRHGDLFVEVVHPTLDGKVVQAPAILTYSPYNATGRNSDAGRWVPRGYARITADVVGTANSGGCYDYGGKREKESGFDLVEWIARQPWATGKTGMIGASYDGTTATATATERPPHLTTIVPEAAISRWYSYAYSGGMRYVVNNEKLGRQGPANGAVIDEQGFDTPLGFDAGFGGTPPNDPQNPRWAERTASAMTPCDEVKHIQGGYDAESPDYDEFWLERDYVKDAAKITIPVLISHNWGDWNVKQEEATNLWRALTGTRHRFLYMGHRWDNHGRPGGEYRETVDRWMDRWLKGTRNGIERTLKPVVSHTSDNAGPLDFIGSAAPRTTAVTLFAQPGGLLSAARPAKAGQSAAVPITGLGTESAAARDTSPGAGANYLYFETAPLTQDVRLFGEPRIRLATTTGREWLTLTPSVMDIDPELRNADGTTSDTKGLVAVTRGFLDTRYAASLASQKRAPGGKPFASTVVAKPTDYIFRAGHRIGLIVSTESNEWVLPKAYDAPCAAATCASYTLDVGGASSLTLPLVGRLRPGRLFAQK